MVYTQKTTPVVAWKYPISEELLSDLREELFLKVGRQWARVVSGSMSPMIRPEDRVLIERVEPERVQLGDIIVFKSSGDWVAHRVVGRRRLRGELAFREKGDLNYSWGLVRAGDVLGRVSAVQRNGSTINLLSWRGRSVQVALALHSAGPLMTRRRLRRVLRGRKPRLCRRLGSWVDGGAKIFSHLLVWFLGGS